MSATAKFESPLYKLFEPGFPPERPIIVDEEIESPETVTLRYEEEAAARANGAGGEYRGDSPAILPMAAYKPQPPQLHGFAESPYSQYSPQSFASQQTENAASQMNQMAFAANNAAAVAANAQYMVAPTSGVSVLSADPSSGARGTQVFLRISTPYDITSMTSSEIYATVLFGDQRCPASIVKTAQDASGACTYRVAVEVPQLMITPGHQGPVDIPLGLVISSQEGNEIARVDVAGQFTYQVMAAEDDTSAHDRSVSPKDTRSPELTGTEQGHHQGRPSPPHLTLQTNAETTGLAHQEPPPQLPLPGDEGTNSYGYSPVAVQQAQGNFAATAAAYGQGNNNGGNMLQAYRTSSFTATDQYRGVPTLRSPHGIGGWAAYGGGATGGGHLDSRPSAMHASMSRPSLTAPSLPVSIAGNPTLVRTTTISSTAPGMGAGGYYNPWGHGPTKAQLVINGQLDSMAQDWTQEEWDNRRRIVLFKKSQNGNKLTLSFRAVSVNDRPPGAICISCIWWAERGECFVTSVDTIHLLEQLLMPTNPPRFPVEEKNRIRRNLEGFKPMTVSKAKADTEEFFKVIMGFGNPKPRNIEKDVKVFPWKILSQALKKIISKYSANPSNGPSLPPTTPTHLLTPVSLSGGGSYALPPTPGPGSSTTATDPTSATGYIAGAHGAADSTMPSPRSLSGIMAGPPPTSWASSYTGLTTRTLSPVGLVKPQTPTPTSSLRISTLPSAYDTGGRSAGPPSSVTGGTYGLPAVHHGAGTNGSHLQHQHTQNGQHNHHHGGHHVPPPQSHAPRWDYGVAAATDTGAYGGHGAHAAGVYGGAYGEGPQRV